MLWARATRKELSHFAPHVVKPCLSFDDNRILLEREHCLGCGRDLARTSSCPVAEPHHKMCETVCLSEVSHEDYFFSSTLASRVDFDWVYLKVEKSIEVSQSIYQRQDHMTRITMTT